MEIKDIMPYVRKFISAELDDGTVISGYVSNPESFTDDSREDATIELLNGLQKSKVQISRIIRVFIPDRENTTRIPVVDTEGITILEKQSFEDKLEELFNQSLSDEIVVTLPDGRRIRKVDDHE
ncbi:MAG: hypothetical protein IKR11_07755 [Solobacterium sp.]|nr:hypothetical protein [Solobacterium sp.]